MARYCAGIWPNILSTLSRTNYFFLYYQLFLRNNIYFDVPSLWPNILSSDTRTNPGQCGSADWANKLYSVQEGKMTVTITTSPVRNQIRVLLLEKRHCFDTAPIFLWQCSRLLSLTTSSSHGCSWTSGATSTLSR